jgi:3-hydroxyacyl-CoA dehydrogenase
MRFANGSATKLLEIVRARETSDETIAACADVARRLDREVAIVPDR